MLNKLFGRKKIAIAVGVPHVATLVTQCCLPFNCPWNDTETPNDTAVTHRKQGNTTEGYCHLRERHSFADQLQMTNEKSSAAATNYLMM